MGMPFKLVLYAADADAANRASKAAYARIAELDGRLSDYQNDSELSRLSGTAGQGAAVPVSEDLWKVLARSQELAERSEGAFDVTVGPYVRLWRRARRQHVLPSSERLDEAGRAVGYRGMVLDEAAKQVELKRPGMRLDLGGIAAGFALDEALAVLRRQGVSRALLDASGDILVGDPPPGAAGWRIGVAPLDAPDGQPSCYLTLVNAAVTTSGDAWQYVEIGGVRYSHIVDPRTGLGLTERSSVTVVAPDCTTADSLATAICVLGPEPGAALAEDTPGVAALIVREVDGKPVARSTKRWKCDSAR